MKVWKKCGALFLTVLLCITMMAVPALAASDSQDGFEVTLTTDKEEYSKGEEIKRHCSQQCVVGESDP